MEKMQFTFTLSEEQQKLKEYHFQHLVKDPQIQKWLKQYQQPERIIYEHTGKFMDFMRRKEFCNQCKGLKFCVQPQPGYCLSLYMDDILMERLEPCAYQLAQVNDFAHKKQYRICDCSDAMLRVDLGKLDVSKESNEYKSMLMEIIMEIRKEKLDKGIYFYGRPGVGKSFLAAGITNYFAKQGKTCAFIHIPTLIGDLKLLFQDKSALDHKLNLIKNVDVAVFDDIGGETVSAWSRDEILLSLLNERMEQRRYTLFTSNYSQSELQEHFAISAQGFKEPVSADRIMERIKALSCEKFIKGTSRRV